MAVSWGSSSARAAVSRAELGCSPALIMSYQTRRGTLKDTAAVLTYHRAERAAPLAMASSRLSATWTKVKAPFSGLTVRPAGCGQAARPRSCSRIIWPRNAIGLNSVVPSAPTPISPAMKKLSGEPQVCHNLGCGFCRGLGITQRGGIV